MTDIFWRLKGNELKYIKEVLDSGFRAGADGAFTTRFENAFAEYYKTNYAIAFNSGTTTMHASLLAMGADEKTEILTPALTPLMCGLAPHYTGAKPIFVDVCEDTFLMNPDDIKLKITEKTKIILVTHMYGGVCDMEKIMAIAQEHNLMVLEDCAQCHAGKDNKGRFAGTIGDVGSWSFENSKQLTCGDGGIVTCNNEELSTKIRKIGGLGFKNLTASSGKVRTDKDKLQNPNWERFDMVGYNYRMNQLAAAVALAQVERTDEFINLRRKMAKAYDAILEKSSLLTPQKVQEGFYHTYYTYSAKFNGSDHGIEWSDFRKKYMEYKGDGIYAAAQIQSNEPAFKNNKIGSGETPIASNLQKKLMNFTTNQSSQEERMIQSEALEKTLKYFGDKV